MLKTDHNICYEVFSNEMPKFYLKVLLLLIFENIFFGIVDLFFVNSVCSVCCIDFLIA